MSIRGTPRGSDENLQYSAASDSFWDVGNFKRTVKRIDDGAKLCDEFMKLVAERAEIEAKYAFKLRAWSKRWEECIRNGPEYGTMEAAMRGTVTEAESRAGIHSLCRDKLLDEVYEAIKKWKNENYHKGIFQWKETKEAEEGFAKAQKPWAKRLAKVERSKKAFHNASRNTEQAARLENEASNNDTDPKIADKLKKLQDAAEKAKRDMDRCRGKYELRLEEITGYNSQYERDMIQEFEKCQENEDKRLEFFRKTLLHYHKCLDISESPEFSGVFVNMGLTFQKADAQADLDWWSRNHGTGMPQNWPMFEEYNEPPPAKRTLSMRRHEEASAPPSYSANQNHVDDNTDYSHQNEINPFNDYTTTASDDFSGPSAKDEWDIEPPPIEDAGIPVRALYDFQGVEEDELNFKEGDVLTQLSSQDDQGWCQGRFQGRVGHFPGSYVEPL